MMPDDGIRTTSTRGALVNTSGGASTAPSTDWTDSVYGTGDGDYYNTSTSVYCDKEEEEEFPIDEEPYSIPVNDPEILIRDCFSISREPP